MITNLESSVQEYCCSYLDSWLVEVVLSIKTNQFNLLTPASSLPLVSHAQDDCCVSLTNLLNNYFSFVTDSKISTFTRHSCEMWT